MTISLAQATDLASAWDELYEVMRATPHVWSVRIYTPLMPIRGWVARVEIEYRPEGHKRNRTDRIDGEGPDLWVALSELTDNLKAWRPR